MMENDDKLLKDFFDENRQEIEDNGFSRRVLHRLPGHSRRLSQIWTTFCFTLALVLFVALDGLQLVLGTLRETFTSTVENSATQLDPKSLIVAGIVLLYLGYRKISTLA